MFLTGVGPLLAWRKTSMESLRRNFGGPLLVGIVAGVVGVALGLRNFYVTVCLILSRLRHADDFARNSIAARE